MWMAMRKCAFVVSEGVRPCSRRLSFQDLGKLRRRSHAETVESPSDDDPVLVRDRVLWSWDARCSRKVCAPFDRGSPSRRARRESARPGHTCAATQLVDPRRRRGIVQAEYQVQVARTADDLTRGRHLVWDSTRVKSRESTLRPYEGPGVESRHRYYWRVRVWDSKRPGLRVERTGLVGDGPAGAVRMDGAVDRARPPGGYIDAAAFADAPAQPSP